MRDLLERLVEQLIASVTDDLAVLLVDAQPAALGILVGDADMLFRDIGLGAVGGDAHRPDPDIISAPELVDGLTHTA